MSKILRTWVLCVLSVGATSCGSETSGGLVSSEDNLEQANLTAEAEEVAVPPEAAEIQKILSPWQGDLDKMVERRIIRALVGYNRTNYFLDVADRKGLAYEALTEFETKVNKKFRTGLFKVQVLYFPVSRDRLITYLAEGRGDIAVGNLTITPERLEMVDFSNPTYSGVKELVITSADLPILQSLEDLSGREVFVRASSSYYQSLVELNRTLAKAGKEKIVILEADENLETDDILEMVNAGLVQITVADDYLADFWGKIFKNLKVHKSLVLRSGGKIGWAFRKGSPLLEEMVNEFVKGHKKGTLVGNILINRYLGDSGHVENSLTAPKVAELSKMQDLFRKSAGDYGFEWLLLAAQGYQESRLNQSLRSRRGAVGVMQILPSTASDPNVNIGNIEKLENNIRAGAKYLRFLVDRYFADEELDPVNRHLFALAAYNAGPRRIVSARSQSAELGRDPNKWFQNVEITVAQRVGRQPVDYVSNIYQYYISYRMLLEKNDTKRLLREKMDGGS